MAIGLIISRCCKFGKGYIEVEERDQDYCIGMSRNNAINAGKHYSTIQCVSPRHAIR
jgi:hypothetical protein